MRVDLLLNRDALDNPDPALAKLFRLAKAPAEAPSSEDLVELACEIYNSRRLRNRFLSASILGEPAWDMLLALYCFSARGETLSVSGLCHASGAPPTTALRWEQVLEQKGMITRTRDSRDARRAFVSLSEKARAMMDDYLATIHAGMYG